MNDISNTKPHYKKKMPFKCGKCLNRFLTKDKLKFHTKLVHSKGVYKCAKCDFTCTSIGQITLHNHNHIRKIHFKADGMTNILPIQNIHQNEQINIQGNNSDKEDPFVSDNESFQIDDAFKTERQSMLNLPTENEKPCYGNAVNSSDNDFIGFENGNSISFVDLSNEETETSLKYSEENSQKGTDSEHIFTQVKTEKQIPPNNINQAEVLHKDNNIGNYSFNPACSKMYLNIYTGIKNEVEKLMLKVQNINDQFQCPLCKKMYKSSCLVKIHLLIHTGEKPFQCTQCTSAFTQNIQLRRHIKNIHNEGLFECIHCDDTFVQKIHLSKHTKEHSGIAPFSCNICQKTFLLVRNVKKHMRDEHEYNKIERVNTAKSNNERISEIENEEDFPNNKMNDDNIFTVKNKSLKQIQDSSKRNDNCKNSCVIISNHYKIQNPDVRCAKETRKKCMNVIDKLRQTSTRKSQSIKASRM